MKQHVFLWTEIKINYFSKKKKKKKRKKLTKTKTHTHWHAWKAKKKEGKKSSILCRLTKLNVRPILPAGNVEVVIRYNIAGQLKDKIKYSIAN